MIQECLELGVSTFDHADIYGDYQNETLFGKALVESGIDRDQIQLISKCGIQMTRGRENKVKHYQYDADYIIWSAERSLKMLETDFLDMFLLHRPSPLMIPEEVFRAVDHLKSSGKIKQFGVSNFTPSQIALLEKGVAVEANQVECSLLQSTAFLDGSLDDCIASSRLAMAWSPLGGYYSAADEAHALARMERLHPLVKDLEAKYECSSSALLLAWLFKHPSHIHPVVGTTKTQRLKEMLTALKVDLELEDWFMLWEASRGHRVP